MKQTTATYENDHTPRTGVVDSPRPTDASQGRATQTWLWVMVASLLDAAAALAATEGDAVTAEVGWRQQIVSAMGEAADLFLARLAEWASWAPMVLVALLVVALFAWLSSVLSRWNRPYERLSENAFVRNLARSIVRMVVLGLGILLALELLDAMAMVGALLGAAGVLGLAVGFAFRDIAENFLASVLLSVRQPFRPNDHVRIESHEGKVLRLTTRSTVLMTLDGNHLRLPNAFVFKAPILNFTRNPRRRFEFGVGVGVEEDLVAAQALGVKALASTGGVMVDPGPIARIEELGDSSVALRFYGWVDQREHDFGAVRGKALMHVKQELEQAGMDLPEPIYRVLLGKWQRPVIDAAVTRNESEPDPGSELGTQVDRAIDMHIEQERAEQRDDLLGTGALE